MVLEIIKMFKNFNKLYISLERLVLYTFIIALRFVHTAVGWWGGGGGVSMAVAVKVIYNTRI